MSQGMWFRSKNDGPMNKSSVTTTNDMTNNSHDGYASVTASIGKSAPATVNMVDGNRTGSSLSTWVEFDMMGILIVPTTPTLPASTWSQSYLTVTFSDGFYTDPYFAQSPPTPTSLPPATPPSGTGGGGNSGGGGGSWGDYLRNAGAQIFGGQWSGAKPNLLGAGGSVAFGLTGLDVYKDALDVSHDLAHWEWTGSHAAGFGLNLIGLIPVIGAVKNVAKVADATKGIPDVAKATGRGAESVVAPVRVVADTFSGSRNAALLAAKKANGIPRSAQPLRTFKPNTEDGIKLGLDDRNVVLYEYVNSAGQKIHIRLDKPASFGSPGGVGDQGWHFNAGPAFEKLNQHHFFGN